MGKRRHFTPEFEAWIVLQAISGEKTNAENPAGYNCQLSFDVRDNLRYS